MLDTLWQDTRYALRTLAKKPGFTTVAVLTLALGIGANTAIFSVVDSLLFRPQPFRDLDRLAQVRAQKPQETSRVISVAPADYLDLRSDAAVFDEAAAIRFNDFNLADIARPEAVEGYFVSANFFGVIGVQAAQGRTFLPDEERAGLDRVAVVSDRLWKGKLGADPNLLGKKITIDGRICTLVGIMPANFHYPLGSDLWAPLVLTSQEKADRGAPSLGVVAHLKRGVSLRHAEAHLGAVAARLATLFPRTNEARTFSLLLVREEQYQYTVPFFSMLQGVAIFILLLAWANVANLLLARILERRKEIAVRSAVGAGRMRLGRQFLTEAFLLCLLAGAVAVSVSFATVDLIRTAVPQGIAKWLAGWNYIRVDTPVLVATLLLSLFAALALTLISVAQSSAIGVEKALKEAASRLGAGRRRHRFSALLVITEFVLAIVSLAGAGLMVKGFLHLAAVYQGFQPANVLQMEISLSPAKYPDSARIASFEEELLRGLDSLPRVESSAISSNFPASNVPNLAASFTIEGRPALSQRELPSADLQTVSESYFRALRIPLKNGRFFSASDRAGSPLFTVISQGLAERFWPGEDPLGRRIRLGPLDSDTPLLTIVGVVGDIKLNWFDPARPTIYRPFLQAPRSDGFLFLRTASSPLAAVEAVHSVLTRLDPAQPVKELQTMENSVAGSLSPIRIISILMLVFGCVALVLAALGVFSVLANSVAQRTQEFGIRMALGATPGSVQNLVLGQTLRLCAAGLLVGLPLALALSYAMASLLFGIVAMDLFVVAGFSLLLVLVAAAAAYFPARRAANLDPISAVRYE